MQQPDMDAARADMKTLARAQMPFGKYKGRRLLDLPEPYLVWFAREGFPKGELGRLLAITLEVKTNGLESLFDAPSRMPERY